MQSDIYIYVLFVNLHTCLFVCSYRSCTISVWYICMLLFLNGDIGLSVPSTMVSGGFVHEFVLWTTLIYLGAVHHDHGTSGLLVYRVSKIEVMESFGSDYLFT